MNAGSSQQRRRRQSAVEEAASCPVPAACCFDARAHAHPACPPAQTSCSFPGSYLVKHPLVPGAAYCQRCEGCPAGRCSATGCSSCTIAGLTKRVAVPGRLNAAGKQVYAC